MEELALEVRDLVKTFPGVRALDGVHFELRRGEVHALVGENGAGKSTLIHVLGGIFPPDAGQLRARGRPVRLDPPRRAAELGIGIVFQELSLAANLSVAENVFFNRQPVWGLTLIDRKAMYAQTEQLLGRFGLAIDPRTPVKRLSAAWRQVVEILKALSKSPEVLILDEPTASLGTAETALLFESICDLKERGGSVIYVSHQLSEVFRIADRVTVLRDGRHVATRQVGDVDEEELARLMVGRALKNIYGTRSAPLGDEVFRLEGGCCGRQVRDVSFAVREGEILGLAGLVGAGRSELGRAIFGAEPLDAGRIRLGGRPVRIRDPGEAVRHRIAYVTEDRKEQGLFLGMSLRETCIAPSLGCFTGRWGFLGERLVSEFAELNRLRYGIVTPSVRQQVRNLSGGNQQKVLLAMWIGIQPLVLVVDEPTRGVDVGAKSEIYRLLRESAARGVAILLISSDLSEILGMCDRILVMREGRLAGEFLREEASEEKIIACAAGVKAN